MNNHAIVIRGWTRTWKWCRHMILDLYTHYAEPVDWYWVTEDNGTTNITEITADFSGRNLVNTAWLNYQDFVLEGRATENSSPTQMSIFYYKWAWFDYHALKLIRQEEQRRGRLYDRITLTRPDYISKPTPTRRTLRTREIVGPTLIQYPEFMSRWPHQNVGDDSQQYVSMGRLAAEIYMLRYMDPDITDSKQEVYQGIGPGSRISRLIAKKELDYKPHDIKLQTKVTPDEATWAHSFIQDIDLQPEGGYRLDNWDNTYTAAQQRQYCDQLNIAHRDYGL